MTRRGHWNDGRRKRWDDRRKDAGMIS